MTWISAQPTQVDLEITRGDSATIDFVHTFGVSGNVAEARFMVREKPDGDLLILLTKSADSGQWDFTTSNAGEITLDPVDTEGVDAGDWFYEIELEHTDGTITTFQKGRFYLRADVATDAVTGVGALAATYLNRQGGSETDWDTAGETDYSPDKIRMQFGSVNITVGAKTITFPKPFTAEPILFITPVGTSPRFATASSISTTQATLNAYDEDGNAPAGAVAVFWMALGPVGDS